MNENDTQTHDIELGRITLTKILTPEGNTIIEIDIDEDLNTYETIGMLTIALDQARNDAAYEYEYEDEDEEEEATVTK